MIHFAFPLLATLAPPNVHDVKSDVTAPVAMASEPAPGRRVFQQNPGYENWDLQHVLYLTTDWKPDKKYPIVVEYPGNGGSRMPSATAVPGCLKPAIWATDSPAAPA